MTATCPNCHQPLRTAARFCAKCGAKVEPQEQTVSSASPSAGAGQPSTPPAINTVRPVTPRLPGIHVKRLLIVIALVLLVGVGISVQSGIMNARFAESVFTAVDRDDITTVQHLVDQHPGLVNVRRHGVPVLLYSAANGHKEITHWLLDKGADVNSSGFDGTTPLIAAADGFFNQDNRVSFINHNPNAEIVKLLLDHGANTIMKDRSGHTAIGVAENTLQYDQTNQAKQQRQAIINLLLKQAGAER